MIPPVEQLPQQRRNQACKPHDYICRVEHQNINWPGIGFCKAAVGATFNRRRIKDSGYEPFDAHRMKCMLSACLTAARDGASTRPRWSG